MDPFNDSSHRHAIRLGPTQLKAFACCHPRGTHKDYADVPPSCFFKAKATIHFIHIAPEPKASRLDPYCSQPRGLCRMNAGFKDLAKATGMRKPSFCGPLAELALAEREDMGVSDNQGSFLWGFVYTGVTIECPCLFWNPHLGFSQSQKPVCRPLNLNLMLWGTSIGPLFCELSLGL